MDKGQYVCSKLPSMQECVDVIIHTAENSIFFCNFLMHLFLVMHFPEDGHTSGGNM